MSRQPPAPKSMLSNREQDLVRRHCTAVCNHHGFRAARRLRSALVHLVEETLQGRTARLTQRHLAHDVFSRGHAFDPESDAIVRVEMGKLRRCLEVFYDAHGSDFPVTIAIPKGSYVPVFRFRPVPEISCGVIGREV